MLLLVLLPLVVVMVVLLLLFSAATAPLQKACGSFGLSGDHTAGRGSRNGVNTIFDSRAVHLHPYGILTGRVW